MRKLFAISLTIVFILVFTANSYAGSITPGNRSTLTIVDIKDVKHSTYAEGYEEVAIFLDYCKEYNVFRLTGPERIVIDIANASAPGKQQIIEVNTKSLKTIRYAQFEEGVARVVLDVVEKPDFKVEQKVEGLFVYLGETPNDKEISSGDNVVDSKTKEDSSKNNDTGKETVEQKSTEKEDNNIVDKSNENSDSEDRGSDLAQRGDFDRTDKALKDIIDIKHALNGNKDEITISLDNYKDYNVMRLSDPDRIVIDIPNASAPRQQQKIDVNGSQVKSIRYAQFQKDVARVVLDISGQSQFKINEKKGLLTLDIEIPEYKNIAYHNNGDRVHLLLEGAKLTEGGENLKKFYTEKYDSTGRKYTITFPQHLADIGDGTIIINDGILDSIQIANDNSTRNTSITFNAKGRFTYRIFTRPDVNNTAITILKPALKSERLVVIDAGHGGIEPGAVYGSLKEKTLNLDIAKRLNNLLKENNVKTFMMREDDSYLGLFERAYIANDLAASLFLSIHNNAMVDKNFGGTMTLYYPQKAGSQSFNGKEFAQIVQNKLLAELKTRDRRIIERPNLVVLRATKMPSALAEIAFLTNAGDRNNLQNAVFRQKAAEALCSAVIEALKKMK